MRHLLLFFSMLVPLISIGQDTLYERDASMYSIKYVLNNDGSFTYSYWHCTGNESGRGTYTKNLGRLKFKFEAMSKDINSYVASIDTAIDGIKVKILSNVDSTEMPFYTVICSSVEGDKVAVGHTDLKGQYIFKGDIYNVASIACGPLDNYMVVRANALSGNGNNYTFYVGNFGKTYVEAGKVHVYKKQGKKYFKYRPKYRVNRWDEEVIRGRVKVWYEFKKPLANR